MNEVKSKNMRTRDDSKISRDNDGEIQNDDDGECRIRRRTRVAPRPCRLGLVLSWIKISSCQTRVQPFGIDFFFTYFNCFLDADASVVDVDETVVVVVIVREEEREATYKKR